MKRGDLVIAAERGRLTAKPRPWLIVQSDMFNDVHPSLTLCLVTSARSDAGLFRIPVEASAGNGLEQRSEVMVDKLFTLSRESVQRVIGTLETETLARVDQAIREWLDL